jgi:hypothetical protein
MLHLMGNYEPHLKSQQYNEILTLVRDGVPVKRMAVVQAMRLQNGSGMENGFNRRIRVLNGFAGPMLGISRTEVERGCAWIPSSIKSLSGTCPRGCRCVAFEGGCKLSRLEEEAFCRSGLTAIRIPSSVEMICAYCFSYCRSLRSITFAVDCKLSRLEQRAFYESD